MKFQGVEENKRPNMNKTQTRTTSKYIETYWIPKSAKSQRFCHSPSRACSCFRRASQRAWRIRQDETVSCAWQPRHAMCRAICRSQVFSVLSWVSHPKMRALTILTLLSVTWCLRNPRACQIICMSNAPWISAFNTSIAERVAQRTKINKMRGGTNTARQLDKIAMHNPGRSDRELGKHYHDPMRPFTSGPWHQLQGASEAWPVRGFAGRATRSAWRISVKFREKRHMYSYDFIYHIALIRQTNASWAPQQDQSHSWSQSNRCSHPRVSSTMDA